MASNNRRTFLKNAGMGLAATGMARLGVNVASAQGSPTPASAASCEGLTRQGPKEVVRGKRMVVSAQHPLVAQTALNVLKAGGNAADAATAAAIAQSTVQLDMTNHTGTITFLYYDAKNRKTHQLDASGTLVPHLPLFQPMPYALTNKEGNPPAACIPGFMPGVAALHSRFGTKSWKSLVEPSIPFAEGRPMDEFTRSALTNQLDFISYMPSSREVYLPTGFLPSVGDMWRNPALAKTLRALADQGPEYFTTGGWAQSFVRTANTMGWRIKIEDLSANPPRWDDPLRWQHKGYEVVQLAPPQSQAIFCNMVLGILKHLDITSLGHYTESAEALYYFAHALRRATYELNGMSDPKFFGVPLDVWMADEFHAHLANIIKNTRPKPGIDLTRHVQLTSGRATNLAAFGYATAGRDPAPPPPSGSTELAIVDADGNWLQMMNTLQGGGIPGTVVDGVPMFGSSRKKWLGVPGSRVSQRMGNTIVFKDGQPFVSMGSPGNVIYTVPQVLSNVLDYNKEPYEAGALPRISPLRDDVTIEIETRVQPKILGDLMKLGVRLMPLPPYDVHMGCYQMAFRDPRTGLYGASTDPRRGGQALGA
jgi:gamma-glutamyltranspeptidase / glutathione hydrolase